MSYYEKLDFKRSRVVDNDLLLTLDESKLLYYCRKTLMVINYYLFYNINESKYKRVSRYLDSIDVERVSHSYLFYIYGYLVTLSELCINQVDVSDCELFLKRNKRLKLYRFKNESYLEGVNVALGNYLSQFDRELAYSKYSIAFNSNSKIYTNFLDVDALNTYFKDVPVSTDFDFNLEAFDESFDSQSKFDAHLIFSCDLRYMKSFFSNWISYAFIYPNLQFNFLLIVDSYEKFKGCVDSFVELIDCYKKIYNLDCRNLRFYFTKDLNKSKTFYACARFYFAHYLLNKKDVEYVFSLDIDLNPVLDLSAYINNLKKMMERENKSLALPITGYGFSIFPWRSHLAGNVFFKNSSVSRDFLEKLNSYIFYGLSVSNSWMLDQNALRYSCEYFNMDIYDLNQCNRGFLQFDIKKELVKGLGGIS